MTISSRVQQQMFVQAQTQSQTRLIRLPTGSYNAAASSSTTTPPCSRTTPVSTKKPRRRPIEWTEHEHQRFLEGLEMYPQGPWKAVAQHVETKSARQAMTHAQKYRQKIERRQRGLRKRGGIVTQPTPRAQLDQPATTRPHHHQRPPAQPVFERTSPHNHDQVQAMTRVTKQGRWESARPSTPAGPTQGTRNNEIDAYDLEILNELLATFDPAEFISSSVSASDSGLDELFAPHDASLVVAAPPLWLLP